jgi:hypothetical protein
VARPQARARPGAGCAAGSCLPPQSQACQCRAAPFKFDAHTAHDRADPTLEAREDRAIVRTSAPWRRLERRRFNGRRPYQLDTVTARILRLMARGRS